MADEHNVRDRHRRIEALLEVVQERRKAPNAGQRLNYQERRFFLKHPDLVLQVLGGIRRHVRVNAIVRKMSYHGLGMEDVDAIWQVLNGRRHDSAR